MLQSIQYGSGEVIVTDSAGNSHVAALLQSSTFDVSTMTKGIKGSGLFDEITAVMGMDVSIKAANAVCSSGMESVATGGVITTGSVWTQTYSVAAAASVTPTYPGSGTWAADLGVIDAAGQPMTEHATPSVGQYSHSSGVYTFNAAETGTIQIRDSYTLTTGETLTVTNTAVGLLVPVKVRVYNVSTDALGVTRKIGREFTSCAVSKFSVSNKVGDFMSADLEFKPMGALGTTIYKAYYA